jgi:hypothetical protein
MLLVLMLSMHLLCDCCIHIHAHVICMQAMHPLALLAVQRVLGLQLGMMLLLLQVVLVLLGLLLHALLVGLHLACTRDRVSHGCHSAQAHRSVWIMLWPQWRV